MRGHVYEPISLGFNCESKFQLSRTLVNREAGRTAADVRRLMASNYGAGHFRRSLFDWQVTPFQAVCSWLEARFEGVYERADMAWSEERGAVVNTIYGTEHPHDFHHARSAAEIDAAYDDARGRFDHLAARFLRHLEEPGAFLYVFTEIQNDVEAARLLNVLNAHGAGRSVHVLFVDTPGCDADLSSLEGRVTKAWRRFQSAKSAEHAWEGPDEAWDAILAPFAIGRDGGLGVGRERRSFESEEIQEDRRQSSRPGDGRDGARWRAIQAVGRSGAPRP